jgi:prevent-host-death family protein
MIWALQDAKNKFSELVDKAVGDGPQVVTRHGKETVVVLQEAAGAPEGSGRFPDGIAPGWLRGRIHP